MRWINLVATAIGASIAAIGGAHADGGDTLCREAALARADTPSSAALLTASAEAERLLAANNVDSAATTLEAASALAPSAIDARSAAAFCAALGETSRRGGGVDVASAQTFLRVALASAETAQEHEIAARSAYRLGLAAITSGPSRARSRGAREENVAVAPLVSSDAGEASCAAALTRGQATQRYGGALLALQCASARALDAGDIDLAARATLRWSRLQLNNAESAAFMAPVLRPMAANAALELLARPEADQLQNDDLRGRLIEVALDAGAGADPRLESAIAHMRADSVASRALIEALRSRVASANADRASAIRYAENAILIESTRDRPERLPEWLLLLAELQPERRAELTRSAYAALEAVRPLLPIYDPLTEESIFSLRTRPVFQAAVAVEVGDPARSNLARAQEIVEAYRQAELESVFGDECVPPRPPLNPGELRPNEIVLYPIVLDDRLEILYARGDGRGYRRLENVPAISRTRLSALAARLASATMTQESGASWQAPAQELYRLLIAPAEGLLEGARAQGATPTLIILPDGPLRAIPFAALQRADGTLLIEHAEIVTAPALSFTQPAIDHPRRGSPRIIAASLPLTASLPPGFEPIPAAAGEARAVLDGRRGRALTHFSSSDLADALQQGNVDVLHLATHASFNGRSEQSFIVADGEVIRLNRLRELIAQNRARGRELDLLVLSACETAIGDDTAAMGLAGAAVQAGAVSAVASLWQVDDSSTAQLMGQFYDAYADDASKAQALRQAQLSLLRDPAHAHPYYWAAFALIGGWR